MATLTLPQGMRAVTGGASIRLPAGKPLADALRSLGETHPVLDPLLMPGGGLAAGLYLFINRVPMAWSVAASRPLAETDDVVVAQPLSGG